MGRVSVQAQAAREKAFQAWLAMNDYLLDCEFLVFDVTGMPEDPFCEAGLKIAEANALGRFADSDEAVSVQNRDLFGKFVRFVGEVFVRGAGGQWTERPYADDGAAYLGVRFPWTDYTLTIPTLVSSAMARRTGDHWAKVYRYKLADQAAYHAR